MAAIIDELIANRRGTNSLANKNPAYYSNIYIWFADAGVYSVYRDQDATYAPQTAVSWNASGGPSQVTLMNGDTIYMSNLRGDQASAFLAFRMWADVAKIGVYATNDRSKANVKLAMTDQAGMESRGPGYSSVVGYASALADPGIELFAVFNKDMIGSSSAGLAPGTYGFQTFLHEIGHLLGLEHIFGTDISRSFQLDVGPYRWNQTAYSVMAYASGYDGIGYSAGLGAFDIAAVQEIFGRNDSYHARNDTYYLPVANGAGIGWMCLWDGGGQDSILVRDTTLHAKIDLRAATLNEADREGAGGYISTVQGLAGGFTIANGAIIENATGSRGNDWLHGNNYANLIQGGVGDDTLIGSGGADTLIGGSGRDLFGIDVIGSYSIPDFAAGQDMLDFRLFDSDPTNGLALKTFSFRGSNNFIVDKKTAQLRYERSKGLLSGDVNGDGVADFTISLPANTALDASALLLLQDRGTTLTGGSSNETIRGGNGDDTLSGGPGSDHLMGGYGADVFRFSASDLKTSAGAQATDIIDDFNVDADKLDFRDFGLASSLTFAGTDAGFFAYAPSLVFDSKSQSLLIDANGDKTADYVIAMPGVSSLSYDHFVTGASIIRGTSNADYLFGSGDVIYGGGGADTFLLGGYNDVIVFTSISDLTAPNAPRLETISNFRSGNKLDFRNFDIDPTAGVNKKTFRFIDSAGFFNDGSAQLRYANNKIEGDCDGNGSADFAMQINPDRTLRASDFILADLLVQAAPGMGGTGDDTIVASSLHDYLMGDFGNDVFRFQNINCVTGRFVDRILDFEQGHDKIDFRNFDIDQSSNVQTRSFTFLGNAAGDFVFENNGKAQLIYSTRDNILYGDMDGNGTTDFQISVSWKSSTTARTMREGDFLLV